MNFFKNGYSCCEFGGMYPRFGRFVVWDGGADGAGGPLGGPGGPGGGGREVEGGGWDGWGEGWGEGCAGSIIGYPFCP